MGMFDYVNVKMNCPFCDEGVLSDFQSKDGPCELSVIDPLHITRLYSTCKQCGEWVEFSRYYYEQQPSHRDTPYTEEELYGMGFKLQGVD